jgi:putative DNA primase/helicase
MGSYVETVADSIIQQLKQGTAPWQKPWRAGERYAPYNPSSEKPYRGMNVLWLLAQGEEKGYSDKRWMTYRQAAAQGAQVRKGEKGTVVQYWKWQDLVPLKDADGRTVLDGLGQPKQEIVKYERPRVFCAVVFNAEQMDGLVAAVTPDPPSSWATHDKAEAILSASGAAIEHTSSDRAFYSLMQDKITLPLRERFPTADGYFATALHELGHWTGHRSRLDRDLAHPFGSEGYAKEELRAEIASLMLGDELAIGHDPTQHVAYVKSWIKVLQNDPKEIFRAASAAEKIKDYVLGLEQTRAQRTEQTPTLDPTTPTIAPWAHSTPDSEPVEVAGHAATPEGGDPRTVKPSQLAGGVNSGSISLEKERTMDTQSVRYLKVPYQEKDQARRAGARWDAKAKSWYAPADIPLNLVAEWLPTTNSAEAVLTLTPREEFATALRGAGLLLEGLPEMDGTMRRVRVDGDSDAKKSGSYLGFLNGHPAGYINNFKTGVELKWKSQIPVPTVTPEMSGVLRQEATERNAEREEAKRFTQAAAALRSERVLAAGTVAPGDHAYLVRKGLTGNPHHLKMDMFGNLLVAAQDVDGNIRSLQRIAADGKKLFTKGGRMDGSHALLIPDGRTISNGDILIIAEGYATAATIERSTGLTVAIAFSAGNLLPVAQAYRKNFPRLNIIIAGDNDHQKPLQIGADGQPKKNVGKEKALHAAEVIGGHALLPPFRTGEDGTDWNDFENLRGREEARQILLDGLAVAQVHFAAQRALEQERPAQILSTLDTLRTAAENAAKAQELEPRLRRGAFPRF